MNSPEDKTPDFDELSGADDAAPEEPLGGPPGPEADRLEFGDLGAADERHTQPHQTGAEPDFTFAAEDTPAEPLPSPAGSGEPPEEPTAWQAPDEEGEAPPEAEAAPGLPGFVAGVSETEQRGEPEGEEKQVEEEAEEEKEPKESLLAKLAKANPYTVLLGIALAALTLGVLCLLLELKAYNFDWKAEGARRRAALPAPYPGHSSTTAAAWPDWVQLSDKA